MRAPYLDDVEEDIHYPCSDGLPLAESTQQLDWIFKIFSGLAGWYRNDPDVFVGSDLFWYPTEGDNRTRTAPDVMVAFGRPKGHRRSYRQWREKGVAPQVVFEIRSVSNTDAHMAGLLEFYQTFGVKEYYVYDPEDRLLEGYRRSRGRLVPIRSMNGYVSPLLGIRFDTITGPELIVYLPDGKPMVTPEGQAEVEALLKKQKNKALRLARQEKKRADEEKKRADEEKKRAEQANDRAEREKNRADLLAAKMRELGLDPIQFE